MSASQSLSGSTEVDALLKLVLIGASNSGKTSLLMRFIDQCFQEGQQNTIGVDFKIKTLQVDDKIAKVQVWDTAGQERFQSVSQAYYRNAHGCIAVYDVSSLESFEAIADQVTNFINYAPTNSAQNIVLVGNKTDLGSEKRQVSFEDAFRLASRMGLAGVVETSAKEGLETLDDSFYIAIVNAIDQMESDRAEALRSLKEAGSRGRFPSDGQAANGQKNKLGSATKTTREQRGLGGGALAKAPVRLTQTRNSQATKKGINSNKDQQASQGGCC